MKVVLLAGGLGTRISEETSVRPKPMVEIGGKPILWHIMKIYATHGLTDFVVCCGYKGYLIKEYFANYFLHMSDVTIDLGKNSIEVHQKKAEPWRVTLVDTGESTQTGGRLRRVRDYIDGDFCLTYGDGVGSVNITELLAFHKAHGKHATMTAVQPPGRFGALEMNGTQVRSFMEKPTGDGGWINGGFFVLNPAVIDLIEGDETLWERQPLEALAKNDQLQAYFHHGFWQPMDTLRDKNHLEELWTAGNAPWKTWE
jgi:glucose-1-phosphate cytidylyltransferase